MVYDLHIDVLGHSHNIMYCGFYFSFIIGDYDRDQHKFVSLSLLEKMTSFI